MIEGDVLGGGLEWLARFDYRWSTPYSLFCFWQRRIGLSPGWGGGRAWAGIIGEAATRSLMVESRLLSGEEARRLGLVDRVVSSWKIRDAVRDWARNMDSSTVNSLLQWKVSREASTFASLWWGPAHRAALNQWSKKS